MPELSEHVFRTALRWSGYGSSRVETALGRVHVLSGKGKGTLPTVVLLHGLGSTGLHYLPLLPYLRGRVRRLVLPDLHGHGFSDLLPPGSSLPLLAAGLIEALDQVLTEPAFIFGNSLGGAAAVRYALARPGNVRGLVLCSPAGAHCPRSELDRMLGQFQFANHAQAVDFVERLVTSPAPLRHLLAHGLRRRFAQLRLQDLVATLSPSDLLTAEELQSIVPPSMLIWGRRDRILPDSQREFYRTHLPAGTRILEPGDLGHSPYLESPGRTAQLLLGFMEEVRKARGKLAA